MNKKSISVLLILTVLMAFVYAGITRYNAKNSDILYSPARGETIETIHLQNENGDLQFYKDDAAQWMVKETADYHVNPEKMNLLVSALENFAVLRKLPQDDAQYGLAKYSAKVSFTTSRGKQFDFIVGNPTMTQTDVYAKNTQTDAVFVTDAVSAAQLTGGISAYRRRDIFSVNLDKTAGFTFTDGKTEIVSVAVDQNGEWQMDYPFAAPARKIEISEFLDDIKDWNIYGYTDTKTYSEQSMGLDGTQKTLTIWDADGNKQTLAFGTVNNTLIPVRNGGKDDILLLYANEVNLDILSAEKLLLVAPFRKDIDTVDTIDVKIGDADVTLQIDHETGTVFCDGIAVDPRAFNSFYVSLMGLAAAGGEAQQVAQPPAAVTITAGMTDGSAVQVAYGERDDTTYYMTINGETRYYIGKDKLTALAEKLKACLL
ncbi:MAG: DUF4340 domain-containing protein [Ruthenibacterium sp.]